MLAAARSATPWSKSGRSTTTGPIFIAGTCGDRSRAGTSRVFGRFLTGKSGEYYFRTIKPVPYPGRVPHIHFKIHHQGKAVLTTQCYVKGHEGNELDGVYRGIRDRKARESVTVDFAKLEDSKLDELAATFDIVLGLTPHA